MENVDTTGEVAPCELTASVLIGQTRARDDEPPQVGETRAEPPESLSSGAKALQTGGEQWSSSLCHVTPIYDTDQAKACPQILLSVEASPNAPHGAFFGWDLPPRCKPVIRVGTGVDETCRKLKDCGTPLILPRPSPSRVFSRNA